MSLKKLAMALVAVFALGAVLAGNAFAAKTTEKAEWYVGTTEANVATLTEDRAITAKIATDPNVGAKFVLEGTIGVNNVPVTLTATAVECVSCFITNSAVTEKAEPVAIGKGQIRFTGVTVSTPKECTARGVDASGTQEPIGTVTTRPLVVHADWMHEGKAFQEFNPQTAGGPFATVRLASGECTAITGNYNVTGTVFSEAVNKTNVFAKTQTNRFSPAIQTTMGAALSLGGKAAKLTGSGVFEVGGNFFGIK